MAPPLGVPLSVAVVGLLVVWPSVCEAPFRALDLMKS